MSVLKRWKNRLRTRQGLLRAARKRHEANPTKASREVLEARKKQLAYANRVVKRQADKTVAFDGCPVPQSVAYILAEARKRGWRGRLNSGLRTEVAKQYGKSTQADLWYAWQRKQAGDPRYSWANPANPPTIGTHILVGDGTYGKYGEKLEPWQVGLDTTDTDQLLQIVRGMGYDLRRTYPNNPSESHHVNFFTDPSARWYSY
jgi:hypothetical protein